MKVVMAGVRAASGDFAVAADGTFKEGIHLVSGDVGSGKTTLALALAGLAGPAAGTIVRTGIGTAMIAFQFPEAHITGPDLGRECMAWGLDPDAILPAAGLAGRNCANPLDLSRGELKRLVLACVLAKDYDLLVLDEPFSSLDPAGKEGVCSRISARKRGITIIFTHEKTHFPRVDRIWEIGDGVLGDRGGLPDALSRWDHAPAIVRDLVARGKTPANIARADLLEAACRT